jgi:PhnB protein
MVKAIPDGYHTLTPAIIVKDARKAIEFYKKALGAREKFVMPGPDGKGVMHAEILIGDSPFMLGEESPHCPSKSAETLGSCPVTFCLYVKDADASFRQAVVAGATVVMPVQEMFWGDRSGSLKDPFGYTWMICTHTRDLSPEEIARGAKEFAMAAAK